MPTVSESVSRDFLSCDWGTSNFRLRLVPRGPAQVAAEVKTAEGVAALAGRTSPGERAGAFAATLAAALAQLGRQSALTDGTPVVVSGMASSAQGWCELPYAELPFSLSGEQFLSRRLEPVTAAGGRFPVYLISGVRAAADVMRGEEVEAVGLAELLAGRGEPLVQATVVLPGTHSKHLCVRDGIVVDFTTYMTGELYALLTRHSMLASCVAPEGEDEAAFAEGCRQARQRPLSALLFQTRTRALLQKTAPAANAAFLSGTLIGAELATLAGRGPGERIVVAAGGRLAERYRQAAAALDLSLQTLPGGDAERLSLLGQRQFLAVNEKQ